MDHLEEDPPFALDESNSPQHVFAQELPSPRTVACPSATDTKQSSFSKSSQLSSSSLPPALMESMMSDDSSSIPSTSDHTLHQKSSSTFESSSTFLAASLPTVSSEVGASATLVSVNLEDELKASGNPPLQSASVGFSQLMNAADDSRQHMEQSRMPIVPENDVLNESELEIVSGTLISPPDSFHEAAVENNANATWLPRWLVAPTNANRNSGNALRQPLLQSTSLDTPLLGTSPSDLTLQVAKTTVRSFMEDDQSFEVSMFLDPPCTVDDVLRIVGNPSLLMIWCDPIQGLVVTRKSDSLQDSSASSLGGPAPQRQYDAEWVEATTTALESPRSGVGYIYSAGQYILQALGFASYGRITMFVERSIGQVGLTIGPFRNGVFATHSIRIFEENGRVRVVDRVRLNQEQDAESFASLFLCNVLDSCLNSCLMPALHGYMDQVTTSLARLRLLIESNDSGRGSLVAGPP